MEQTQHREKVVLVEVDVEDVRLRLVVHRLQCRFEWRVLRGHVISTLTSLREQRSNTDNSVPRTHHYPKVETWKPTL